MAEQNLDERPDLVIGLVADQLATGFDPMQTSAALAARREQAAADARSRLTSPEDRARFDRALTRAAAAYPVLEDNEYYTISGPLALIRRAALEMGRRLTDRTQLEVPDDVFYLEPGEAIAALRDGAGGHDLAARAKANTPGCWLTRAGVVRQEPCSPALVQISAG